MIRLMGLAMGKSFKEIYLDMHAALLKIRKAEDLIVDVYAADQSMRTPTHLSIGQEAVAVGLNQCLHSDDQMFVSHRCHAAVLARGVSLLQFFSELCGRASGLNQGRAGSAHLTSSVHQVYASPILGAMIPVACGAALSFQMNEESRVAVAMFGDGTIEEGVFAESVNFAVTKKLPVLFVCENNLYSTHSAMHVRQPYSPIYERVSMTEFPAIQIDGNNLNTVYKTMSTLVNEVRQGRGPRFVECLTYRIREHVGPLMDADRGYRSSAEVNEWIKKCPLARFEQFLMDEQIVNQSYLDQQHERWTALVREAYDEALGSPWPKPQTLLDKVY